MKVVASAGGRFNAFYLVKSLVDHGILKKFYTTSYTSKDGKYIPARLVNNAPIYEWIGRGWKFLPAIVNEKLAWNVVKDNLFDLSVQKKLQELDDFDLFVGWANFSLHSIPVARSKGAKIILESGSTHIQYQSDILSDEYYKFGIPYKPVTQKNIDKMVQEYDESDFIMIPSSFVKRSFLEQGIDANKLLKVPYGVEWERFYKKREEVPKKFRVIFVGMLGIRKGLYYLLKAWEKLNLPADKVELLLVGNVQSDFKSVLDRVCLSDNVKFADPSDRNELAKMYQESSVFVHPSIEEGLSMVQAEAMASGLPLICTTNTGGQDLIENEKEGFVIPIRSVEALSEKILWCYQNRDACFEMGKLAQEKIKTQTWENYGNNVVEEYKKILKG